MAEDLPITQQANEQADMFTHRSAVVEMNKQTKQDEQQQTKKSESQKSPKTKSAEQHASQIQRQIQTSEDIRDALQDKAYLDSIQEKSLAEIQKEIEEKPLEERSVQELVELSLALEKWYGENFDELAGSNFPDVISNVHDPVAMRQTIANVLEEKGIDLNAQLALGAFTFEDSSAPSGAEAGAGPAGVTPVYLVPEVDVRSLPFVDTMQILETMNRRYASNRAEPRELNDARMHVLNKIGMVTTDPALQRKLLRMAHRLEIAREKLENRENARSILEKKIDIRSRAHAEEDAGRFVVSPGQTIETMNLLDVITQLASNRSNEDILLEWQETLSAFTPDQTKLIYGERETDFVKNIRPAIDLFANAIRDNRIAQQDQQAYLRELARRDQIEKDFENTMRAELLSGDVQRIQKFIDLQFNGSHYGFVQERFNKLVGISLDRRSFDSGFYGYALEYATEQILKKSDKLPNSGFVQPSFEEGIYLSKLRTSIMKESDRDNRHIKMFKYLSELQEVRHVVHELYNTRKDFETKKKFIASAVRPERMNYAENEIPGVLYYLNIAEKYYGMAVGRSNYLLKEDLEKVDEKIEQAINRALTNGQLTRTIVVPGWGAIRRNLTEVEKDRAMVMGPKAMAISQRRVVYSVLGDVPGAGVDRYRSLDSQQEAERVAPFKILFERYFVEASEASAEFLRLIKKHIRRTAIRNGKRFDIGEAMDSAQEVDGEKKMGLYGNSEMAWILNQCYVWDPKSNGWRGRNLFLDNELYTPVYDVAGNKVGSVVRYLEGEWKGVKGLKQKGDEGYDISKDLDRDLENALSRLTPDQRAKEEGYLNDENITIINKQTRMKQIIYSQRIEARMLEQRLSLGVLVREANFSPRLLENIWSNISQLLPSRIAAFFPYQLDDILIANGMVLPGTTTVDAIRRDELFSKLYLAEMQRVLDDRAAIQTGTDPAFLPPLTDYFAGAGMTPDDAKIVLAIMDLGKKKSGFLARIPHTYVAFLDDAVTCWDELDDRDIDRVLIGDQENFAAGYSKLAAHVLDPGAPLEESRKGLAEAKKSFSSPMGLGPAQKVLEPWVLARSEFYAMSRAAKWFQYSISRMLNKPTSRFEEFNPNARISMDERALADDLGKLAGMEVIGNEQEPSARDAEGLTQFERIRKLTNSRIRNLFAMYIRMLLLLFPIGTIAEFFGLTTQDITKMAA